MKMDLDIKDYILKEKKKRIPNMYVYMCGYINMYMNIQYISSCQLIPTYPHYLSAWLSMKF